MNHLWYLPHVEQSFLTRDYLIIVDFVSLANGDFFHEKSLSPPHSRRLRFFMKSPSPGEKMMDSTRVRRHFAIRRGNFAATG